MKIKILKFIFGLSLFIAVFALTNIIIEILDQNFSQNQTQNFTQNDPNDCFESFDCQVKG